MVGKYDIKVYNNRVSYHFVIKRNITIIQGDSGTGKTSLFNLISDYNQSGRGTYQSFTTCFSSHLFSDTDSLSHFL